MIKFFLGLGCVLLIATLSCNSSYGGDKPQRKIEDYALGVFAAYLQFRPAHDSLLASLVQATTIIYSAGKDVVDLDSLHELLDNARAARQICLDRIKNITEIDSTISLKESLVAFLDAAKQFYDSDYDKLLSPMVSPKPVDSTKTLKSVLAATQALDAKRESWLATYQTFKEKYGMETYSAGFEQEKVSVGWSGVLD